MDRGQAFLLPPDMADWLPEDHLVWFLIDAVEAMDTSVFHSRRARAKVSQGRAGFDPDMLVTLLLYAYAHKVRSSRQIERLCGTDVAFRVICAQDVPDHTAIARFRSEHEEAFKDLFEQVLVLCVKAGLGRVGSIAVDGTKIAANASIDANRTEEGLRAEIAREVERIVGEATATDAAEDAVLGDKRGDELPPSMRGRGGDRVKRLRECLAQIETETTERAAEQTAADATADATVEAARERVRRAEAKAQAAVDDYQARWEAAGRRPGGRPAQAVDDSGAVRRARERLAKAEQRYAEREARLAAAQQATVKKQQDAPRRNVTDPDSRIMKTRKGWTQGYNAQLAVTDDHLILATAITQDTTDTAQCVPMTTAALAAAALIGKHHPALTANGDPHPHHGIDLILFDAGYLSEDNLTATGPDRLIALGKARDQHHAVTTSPTTGPPPKDAPAIDQMRHRLQTPEGHRAYKRRSATVETVIGHLKDLTGLRTFSRRGLTAATSELHLAAATTNLLKLHRTCTT
ncbi:DDE transposase [Kribbella speibonae]|uniref:DDE transposase n=1 Tax=Kribbella speibonae TaxID=1572660 RepID=A0A4R0IBT5_9ACTN|nr:DDE transposase [Kribbella speibonae]